MTHFSCFLAYKNGCIEILYQRMHAHTDSRLLFQKWSKSVQDKWPKSHVRSFRDKKSKHVLAPLGGTHGAISRIFCVSAHRDPSLMSEFHPNLFRFQGVITEKPIQDTSKQLQIGSFSL